jgi:uncharacterized protein YciI
MPMIIRCYYRSGGAEARFHIRDVHVSYMIEHRTLIETGGAILSEDGHTAIGMFLVLDIESVAEAEAFLAREPYTLAGLFEERTIERLDRFIPHPDPDRLNRLLVAARAWIDERGKSVRQNDR